MNSHTGVVFLYNFLKSYDAKSLNDDIISFIDSA